MGFRFCFRDLHPAHLDFPLGELELVVFLPELTPCEHTTKMFQVQKNHNDIATCSNNTQFIVYLNIDDFICVSIRIVTVISFRFYNNSLRACRIWYTSVGFSLRCMCTA